MVTDAASEGGYAPNLFTQYRIRTCENTLLLGTWVNKSVLGGLALRRVDYPQECSTSANWCASSVRGTIRPVSAAHILSISSMGRPSSSSTRA
jgi:hypothetical protein